MAVLLQDDAEPLSLPFSLGDLELHSGQFTCTALVYRLCQRLDERFDRSRHQRFVVFDVEATSTHIGTAELLQIGAVVVDNGRIAGEPFCRFVRPSGPGAISFEVTRLTGIGWPEVADAQGPAEVVQAFLDFAGDAPLVGHNIDGYDLPLLRRICQEHGLAEPARFTIDTMKVWKRLHPNERWDLDAALTRDEKRLRREHRADLDARLNARVFIDLMTMLAHRTAARVQETLRGRLYDKIVALGPAWFGAERTGGVMLSIVDGVEQLQTFFGQYLPQVTIAACAPVAIFAFMAFWDIPVATVMLAAALFTLVAPAVVHERTNQASRTRQSAFKAFGEEFLDADQGLPTLKAFGESGTYGRMLADKAKALSDSTFLVLGTSILTRGITDLGCALGAAAALALGAYRVRHGEMSLEALLIVLMAGTEIFRPLRDLRTVLHQGLTGQAAAAGINALLDETVTAPSAPSLPRSRGRGEGLSRVAGIASAYPRIAFNAVTFAYPGGRRAAHQGLSFGIDAGERVGIVGPSGSGKSTIVRLLLRLHDPQTGTIQIGGHDLRSLDPEAVRRMIAVVAQDTYLFHGTIEDNLRLGRPDATEADLVAAARAANAHEFIDALPDGYQTVIGERGARLSGGQRQRIAIARALLRDAPILILDEALSSVDAENEAVIQQALDRLMVGRTTLILAHRLSSVINADRILVLEDGTVAEAAATPR